LGAATLAASFVTWLFVEFPLAHFAFDASMFHQLAEPSNRIAHILVVTQTQLYHKNLRIYVFSGYPRLQMAITSQMHPTPERIQHSSIHANSSARNLLVQTLYRVREHSVLKAENLRHSGGDRQKTGK
jgi:hypothetical protein